MRRMNSKNGIIDIVNEAIDEGQIEVGGGLPEIEEGDAGKVLKVNEAEDGVEWGEAGGGSDDVLTLDFNNEKTLTITEEQYTKFTNKEYAAIVVKNFKLQGYSVPPVLTLLYNPFAGYYLAFQNTINTYSESWISTGVTFPYFYIAVSKNTFVAQMSHSDNKIRLFSSLKTLSVGTSTWYDDRLSYTQIYSLPAAVLANSRFSFVQWDCSDRFSYIIGHADEYDNTGTLVNHYKVVLTKNTSAEWNVTVTAVSA